ncbi:MAG TPA: LytTR family DNA-binding domain-containing protein [Candidatus Acidoferrum sp.]|jgi:two-component system LytT family response regulator|nr:LytTR family DNA-binding domain-containing protein [Candidatus Acidoferrum sp.]
MPLAPSSSSCLRVLVVDDEAPARRKLLRLLRTESGVEVAGEADNAEAAIAEIEKHQPDLVFLDVQMPGADGFDVVRAISSNGNSGATPNPPRFVFVTAHDQYAVRAFEVHAFDYLLKPVGEDRFREVLRRAQEQHKNGDAGEKRLRGLIDQVLRDRGFSDRLLIREENRAYFVNVREISWIESERNYLLLHCGAKSHTMRGTLDSIEETLDPKLFARINRSSIVRLDAIREMLPWFHSEYKVILHDKTELRWSRRYVTRRPELLRNL